jgi:hypothetical protein
MLANLKLVRYSKQTFLESFSGNCFSDVLSFLEHLQSGGPSESTHITKFLLDANLQGDEEGLCITQPRKFPS